MNMNSLPMNDYTEYFEQLAVTLPDLAEDPDDIICIPYETSRGCWWGQKHHCTFCGLNGLTMAFRQKTPELAINEFDELFNTWPVTRINVADNIMPHTYFKTLVPALAKSNSKEISIFYEQKSNLSLKKILALRDAGINRIQPGIESLSTSQLKRMDKGVTAHQNLNLLRYARSAGVHVAWNLLVGFPGDQEEDYQEIIDLFPLISHLEPPGGVYKVVFDRFSPYFMEPEKYGVRNLRPSGPYYKHYPEYTDYFKLAYHFEADIDSAMVDKPELVESLRHLQKQWKQIWWPGTEAETPRPNLIVSHLYGDQYALADTRGLPESEPYTYLNGKQVSIVLRGCDIGVGSSDWALERKLIFEIDGRLAPLATSSPELISHFEMVAADPQLKVG